jgi:hypothetical protein
MERVCETILNIFSSRENQGRRLMKLSGLIYSAAVAAMLVAISTSTASAQLAFKAVSGGGVPDDEQTSIIYDAETGLLGLNAPASTELTSINIDSEGGLFAGMPENLDGDFDIFSAGTIFKATFGSSFGDLSFGMVYPVGLSEADVLADFTVDGSLAVGGGLGDVDLIYIPEPTSCVLLSIGLVGITGMAWRRRRR